MLECQKLLILNLIFFHCLETLMKPPFFVFCFLLLTPLLAQSQVNQIAAKVNNEVITAYEVEQKISKAVEAVMKSNISVDEKKEKIRFLWKKQLQEMAQELLTLQAAKKAEVSVSNEDILRTLQQEKVRVGGEENLQQILSDEGISFEDFQDNIRNRLVIERLFSQEAGLQNTKDKRPRYDNFVSPQELRAFYKENQLKFAKEEEIKLRQIVLFARKKGSLEKAQEIGESLLRQLEEGGNFEELAKLYDDGPEAENGSIWPVDDEGKWLPLKRGKGSVRKEVEEVAFKMEPGQVSPLIPWDKGYFIIKVESYQKAEVPVFEDVQDHIRVLIQQKKVGENIKKVSEELRQNSYIWPEDLFE
jgi:foldase protein PrsA